MAKDPQLSNEQLKEQLIAQHQKQSTNSEYPTEIVELPSKGLVYPLDSALSSGKVEMKYMTAKEEDILTSDNLLKKGIAIDRLLQSLIVGNGDGKRINFNELLIGDKNAIMFAARVLGYGAKFETEVACPKCGTTNIVPIDISQFKDKEIDESLYKNANEFSFTLPVSKKVVMFRLTTHGDELKASQDARARKGKNKFGERMQSQITTRLKQQIISVDGNDEKQFIDSSVDQMLSRDALALRQYILEITPDLDTSIYFECTECGHEEESMSFPLTSDFFWPRASR